MKIKKIKFNSCTEQFLIVQSEKNLLALVKHCNIAGY
jgi:hypothetical protein